MQRALPFLLLPAFVRHLTPSEYGQVAVLTAAFTLVSMTFGLGQDVVEYSRFFDNSQDGRQLFCASVWLLLITPLPLGVIVGTFVIVADVTLAGVPPTVLAGSVLAGAMYVVAWRFPAVQLRCLHALGTYLGHTIGYASLAAALKAVLIVGYGWGPEAWAVGDLAAGLALFGWTSAMYRRRLRGRTARDDLSVARAALTLGLPVALSQGARWSSGFADRIFVVAMVGAAAGGTYQVAVQLVSVGGLLVLELSTYMQPHIARAENAQEAVEAVLARHLSAVCGVSVFAAGGSILLVYLGFAGSYTSVASVAVLLSASLPFLGLAYLGGDICGVKLGATSYLAASSFVSGGAAVLLSLVLIPPFGLVGAAAASILTQALGAGLLWGRILPALERLRRVVVLLLAPTGVCIGLLSVLAVFAAA